MIALSLAFAAPGQAATKEKRCGSVHAAGRVLRVTIYDASNFGFRYSCRTARGVIRTFARTRPTQQEPLGTFRYAGDRWDCYLDRYGTGVSCRPPLTGPGKRSYRWPSIGGAFG